MSFAEDALAAVEAALLGKLTDGVQSFSIAGRTISNYSIAELFELRDKLREEVRIQTRTHPKAVRHYFR